MLFSNLFYVFYDKTIKNKLQVFLYVPYLFYNLSEFKNVTKCFFCKSLLSLINKILFLFLSVTKNLNFVGV